MPDEKQVAVMQQQGGKAVAEANALEVTTPEQYEAASGLLTRIKSAAKMIKAEMDKVLQPILEAEKAERNRWRPIMTQAADAEATVKMKMLVYVNETERLAKEKEAKIQADLEAGKIKKPETALKKAEAIQQAPETVRTETGASQVKKVKVVRINNPDLVPDKYWVMNEVLIRKEALAGVEIPGVEVALENSIAGLSR